ncbi:MAG: hypothetical protein M3Z46_13325, partial [Actinomycetota bacterium]|nr:hypothetical protein [Actinomycetota bacterium]
MAIAFVAAAAGCLAAPGNTSAITLVSSSTISGWKLDYYRNTAYPCSISGYQTFTIATKTGSSPTAAAPLWVFMHGGGAGFFDTTGTPRPDATQMTEEPAVNQRSNLSSTTGLLARVRADAAGYRLLAVSYCNRDIYAGTGQTDPNNPNALPDGSARTTGGLLATKAAVQYTQAALPTTKTIVHGASAGSVGAYYAAYAMQLQGIAPAGVVGDASVLNVEADNAAYDQGACRKGDYSPSGQAAVGARIDPEVADTANEVDKLVSNGRLTVPLLNVWNHGDVNSCGNHTMSCPLRNGSTTTLSVTDCEHQPLAAAITAEGTGTTSKNLPLCVSTAANPGACDKHQVTVDVAGLTNTDPSSPADYLT